MRYGTPCLETDKREKGSFVSERFLFARASHQQSERARRLPLTRRLPAPRCLISTRWRAAQPHAVAQRGAARRLQGARCGRKQKEQTKKKGSLARAEPVRAALHLSPRRGIELDASQVLRPAGRRACVLVAAVTNFPRRSDLDGFGPLAALHTFQGLNSGWMRSPVACNMQSTHSKAGGGP